jgi:hypothetical protein
MTACGPTFAHLDSLTDRFGTFEHALYARPRPEHGYCTDDNARVLVVTLREPDPAPEVSALTRSAFRFVTEAQGVTGNTRNRRAASGRWHGPRTVEDCWGRSLWAFGVAVERRSDSLGDEALASFERGAARRSPWPRSMAYAALGAAAVLQVHPHRASASALLSDAADLIGRPAAEESWPWPEPRLSYANALLPDALIAAGSALRRPALITDGLHLLEWLLDRETVDGHLSVTPAGGSGPRDAPGFDQQPIEVATLAEACARAAGVTGDARWAAGVRLASAWFDGDNDTGARMWDPVTGGGYDGLEATGVNLNQGAESTIALISTRQHARVVDKVSS